MNVTNGSYHRNRPPVKKDLTDVSLMQIETDAKIMLNPFLSEDSFPGEAIRFFGTNMDSNSVCIIVHGWCPAIYYPASSNISKPHEIIEAVNSDIFNSPPSDSLESKSLVAALVDAKIVRRRDLYCFTMEDSQDFVELRFRSWKALKTFNERMKNLPEHSATIIALGGRPEVSYHWSMNPELHFMNEHKISSCCWITAPHGKYIHSTKKISHCQIEIHIDHKDLIAHEPVDEWALPAPVRILSFDLECTSRPGNFPNPNEKDDQIIQIGAVMSSSNESEPSYRSIICLRETSAITDVDVICVDTEEELLEEFGKLIITLDPDILTGYNINGFDFYQLFEKSKFLQAKNRHFPKFGRLIDVNCTCQAKNTRNKQMGNKDSYLTTISGRVVVDMIDVIKGAFKLRSYSLNNVSLEFLGQQKEDVHYSQITPLFNGTPEDRRRIAVYCVKDCVLPILLMNKLMTLFNYFEMARVTGVTLRDLMTRGQGIKCLCMFYKKAKEHDLLIPIVQKRPSEDKYQGATVLEPKTGFYPKSEPITTMDFSSLYPSIMIAHNMCYSTLLDARQIKMYGLKEGIDYTKVPGMNVYFANSSLRAGIVPEVLEGLLSARKQARKDLAAVSHDDPDYNLKKAVLNGRQLALKVSANSVYGFTGSQIGFLPCLEISSSVTAFGREMIEHTKFMVESRFNWKKNPIGMNEVKEEVRERLAKRLSSDENSNTDEIEKLVSLVDKVKATVIYGDTDSVMVKFGAADISVAMILGDIACNMINETFKKPISLEFEKVYAPYLLMNKKRYAGLWWTKPEKFDKIDTKGIEAVRRDNCKLVKNVFETCLRLILVDENVEEATRFVQGIISALLKNQIDMSQLVISKSLSQKPEDYKSKAAHVALAIKLAERPDSIAPSVGDRIPYVMIEGDKKAKGYEKSEDPVYAIKNKLALDTDYYIENQLQEPLKRLFEPIMGDKLGTLFEGAHTRSIRAPQASSGLTKHFAVRLNCLSCKAPVKNKEPLCQRCMDAKKGAETYTKFLRRYQLAERQASRLWSECQRCTQQHHSHIACSSTDCPLFYAREKALIDMEDISSTLERFS